MSTTTTHTGPATAARESADFAAVLTTAFGTTVAMWAAGYSCRLPALLIPSPIVLLLVLGCVFAGGFLLGRLGGLGWIAGVTAGLITGLLNLLILGSFLAGDEPDRIIPSAMWWVPGSILATAVLAGAGSALGQRGLAAERRAPSRWLNAFAWVAVGATALLLAVGGLVTSAEAGLAVDDWPTSFGYNMFLYPFSKMTGGIYYEHAHRLIGALVGLTTVVLAVFTQLTDKRRWVRLWAWLLVPTVVLQGILGGIRVTERSLGLAMVHGVLAQLFFAALVALAAFTSARWSRAAQPLQRPGVSGDRLLGATLVGVTILQLVLGAAQRHFQELLIIHMVTGLAVVAPLALHLGIRAWALNRGEPFLQRLGQALLAGIVLQVLLGFGAFVVTAGVEAGTLAPGFDLVVATTHQWFGALVLATSVLVLCWSFRLLAAPQGSR